jgi:hypothetical protein
MKKDQVKGRSKETGGVSCFERNEYLFPAYSIYCLVCYTVLSTAFFTWQPGRAKPHAF